MVSSVTPDNLTTKTPCDEWDVRGIVTHMIGVCQNFAGGFGGAQMQAVGTGESSDDLASAYRAATDALLKEARAPGALEKTLKLPFGEMPADRAIGIAMADQMIHTWDLSKALGKPFTMDETLATVTLQGMHQLLTPERRGPGKAFAAEVPCPENAPIQDRLVAFSGRQP
jgi:uncharacterized protein (TIGR03086 family)